MTDLWAEGDFAQEYMERNAGIGAKRGTFWNNLLRRYPVASVIEAGCGSGNNLQHLRRLAMTVGIDVYPEAVEEARCLGVRAIVAPASDIPYPDASFGMVVTAGVLIHIGPDLLPRVMDELHRVSSRYICIIEYDAENETEVPYRGHAGALWKRPYRRLFQERFPQLILRESGFLAGPASETGWDDVTYWCFERP